MNADQQRGVVAPGHLLITAGPGSGKTRVLVERTQRILSESDQAVVCCVTFTRDSANEIRERLEARLGKAASKRILTGTFHALAIQQLKAHGTEVNIVGEAEQRFLLRRAWEESGVNRKDLNFTEAVKSVEYHKSTRMPAPEKSNEQRVIAQYETMLQEHGSMDFTDVLTKVVDGMEDRIIQPLAITHLLVDEFQDADSVNLSWVLAHANAGIQTTVVGDDDQSIYSFRHALGFDGMNTFLIGTNAEQVTLAVSYRCAPEVLGPAARLIRHNKERVPKQLRTMAAPGGTIVRKDFADGNAELTAAGTYLQTVVQAHSAVLLSRTKFALKEAATIYEDAEIPYEMVGGGSIWSAGVPAMMRNLLNVSCGQGGRMLANVLMSVNVPWVVTVAALQHTEGHARPLEAILTKDWLPKKQMSDRDDARWADLCHRIDAFRSRAMRDAAPEDVIDGARAFFEPSLGDEKRRSLADATANILKRRRGSLRERLANLDRDSDKKDADGPKRIQLMTLHGSKGLEWDVVWMIGLNQGVLPHSDGVEDEERRLCYVGMTRARDVLVMSRSVADGQVSKFLGEAGLELDDILQRQ
ncbi:MAG: ATP-dependent helicase [Rhodanobacter sp.]